MIAFNIILPRTEEGAVKELSGDTFRIVHFSKSKINIFFHIEAEEEHYTYLSLKYNSCNIWKR